METGTGEYGDPFEVAIVGLPDVDGRKGRLKEDSAS